MSEEDKKNLSLKTTYTDEEIDILLDGDRRKVDKFMLHCMNEIKSALMDHTQREDLVLDAVKEVGGIDGVKARAAYVDTLIKKEQSRIAMMEKITQSGTVWALIAAFTFIAAALWEYVVKSIKAKLGV